MILKRKNYLTSNFAENVTSALNLSSWLQESVQDNK